MRVAIVATAACFSLIGMAVAAPADAAIRKPIDIPAQRLGPALQSLAKYRGVQLVYLSDAIDALESPGLIGELTLDEALHQLLNNTGFSYRYLDDTTVTVFQTPAAAAPLQLAQAEPSTPAREEKDENAERRLLSEVVVTGTHIKGLHPDSSPMISFDRHDIEASGYGSLVEFTRSLPQNFAGSIQPYGLDVFRNSGTGEPFNTGSGTDLRGLGVGTTLTLVNGHRMAQSGLGEYVDVSSIPLAAVERVEVLTDGASALYGSEAIGGVVNYTLRKDFEGAETAARYGNVSHGSSRELALSQIFGRNWGSGNVVASYEYYDREHLSVADRLFVDRALVGGDLSPKIERQSAFVAGRYSPLEHLDIGAELYYSGRSVMQFTKRADDPEPSTNAGDSDQYSVVLSGGYALPADWSLDAVGSYSWFDNNTTAMVHATVQSGNGTEDVFQPFASRTKTKTWSGGLTASGPLFELPAGAVRAALGADYRDELIDSFLFDAPFVKNSRDVRALYGEVFVPIVSNANGMPGVERLELTAAVRHEEYSDFGKTTNPKYGFVYAPVQGLAFRGSYGTSFRAPYLYQGVGSWAVTAFDDPVLSELWFGPEARGSLIASLVGDAPAGSLRPEEATVWTAGVDLNLPQVDGLKIKLTYYNIDYQGKIQRPDIGLDLLNHPEFASPLFQANPPLELVDSLIAQASARNSHYNFTGLDTRDPAVVAQFGGIIDTRLRNIGSLTTDGVDFSVDYMWSSGAGDFSLTLNATKAFGQHIQILETTPAFDIIDTLGAPLDLRARGGLSWTRGGWGLSTFVNYADDYTNTGMRTPERIGEFVTVDLQARLDAGELVSWSAARGLQLRLSAQNIFDRDPPHVGFDGDGGRIFFAPIGFDPTNADPTGRFVSLDLSKRW